MLHNSLLLALLGVAMIAPSMRADLLLLEGNPLADIKNTRRIAAVIVGGKLYSRSELNARMEGLRGGSG